MSYALKIWGLAGTQMHGDRVPVGEWVRQYDPDAANGLGDVLTTTDPEQALRFASFVEAFAFWKQTSKVRPVRHDGKPNRPLTAYNVMVETIDE